MNKPLSDALLPVSDMPALTAQEAERGIELYHSCDVLRRQILLALFEGKAHKTLRYSRFEEFAAERLNLSDVSYTYDLLRWARVERTVLRLPQISVMTDIWETSKAITSAKLPQRTALQLAKLPSEELQIAAWTEAKSLEKYGTHTPAQITSELKKIVVRRLNNDVPAASHPAPAKAQPLAPVAPVRPKPDMTPVVPPTYDRGEAFDMAETEEEPPQISVMTEIPSPPEERDIDPAVCAALAFMREFVTAYKQADRNAFDELFRDAMRYLKEYGP